MTVHVDDLVHAYAGQAGGCLGEVGRKKVVRGHKVVKMNRN